MSRSRKVAYEAPSPQDRPTVIPCQIAAREAAARPEPSPLLRVQLSQMESAQVDESDPTRERFGDASDQPGRGAAEEQEPRTVRGPVHQHADRLEEGRQALDLVDDDQSFEGTKRLLGSGQTASVDPGFQVKIRTRRVFRCDPPGEGGFPTLARAGQRDAGVHREFFPDTACRYRSFDEHSGQ